MIPVQPLRRAWLPRGLGLQRGVCCSLGGALWVGFWLWATQGVLVTTPEGSVITFNQRFVDLLQLPAGWEHIQDVVEMTQRMPDNTAD
jgi:hypothetical protein